jgi:hypothetical protein
VVKVVLVVIHGFAFLSVGESCDEVRGYVVVNRAIAFAHELSVFVAELIEYFVEPLALRALVICFLHDSVVYNALNVCHARAFIMVVIAAEYNCLLRSFLALALLTHVEPR